MELTQQQRDKLEALRPELELWRYEKASKAEDFMLGLKSLIQLAGDEPDRNGLQETPFRVFKAFMEYTDGYTKDPKEVLGKSFDVSYDEVVIVKDIEFNSMCEHHFAPFFGKAHIAYIPKNNVITGLSKFARLVDIFAHRFQVQERLTSQIANTIEEVLDPLGVAVILEAKHYCMCGRGVKKGSASTITSSMRGVFREKPEARAEIMQLIKE